MTTLNTTTLSSVQLSQVIEQLNNLSTDELVNVYIDYAEQNSYERIYNLDESTIDELYSSPWQALYDSNHKDFNDRDYFFTYNGNGHMVSFSNEDDKNCPIDTEELAQWIVDNDLFNDYNIVVTTLEDMLASIEDNINDSGYILSKLADYLGQSLNDDKVELLKTDDEYYEYLVNNFMNEISDYSYNDLYDLINTVGINYSV